MYPRDFFDTYWRSELRDEVFVAMPFHDEFASVWEEAIVPAVDQDIPGPIRARRVDSTVLSGSVITDILDGVAHAKLILADISVARSGFWSGQRNGNVMYEVGLAHAVRQSTEIALIRSDDDPINFDVAHIKIHRYDRSDITATRKLLLQIISELFKQVEQEKSLKVAQAIEQLDADSIRYMREFAARGPFSGPNPKTMREQLVSLSNRAALSRLQQLGIIRCSSILAGSSVTFAISPFGRAVATCLGLHVASA